MLEEVKFPVGVFAVDVENGVVDKIL